MFSCLRRMRLTGELKGRFVRIVNIATKLNNKTECKRAAHKMLGAVLDGKYSFQETAGF